MGNMLKGKLIDLQKFIDETNMNKKLASHCDIVIWSNQDIEKIFKRII